MSNRMIGIAEQSNDALADIAAVSRAMLRQMQENAQNAAMQEKISTTLCEKVISAVLYLCAAINSIRIMSTRVRKAQKDFIMTYILEHLRFEQGKNNGPDEKSQRKDQWPTFCHKYNKIGETHVTPHSLKAVKIFFHRLWTGQSKRKRMEIEARKEWAENKKKPLGNVTGEGTKMMSTDKLKMICIVGTSHGNGLPLVPEVGLGYPSEFDEIVYDPVASIAEGIEIREYYTVTQNIRSL
ncbi:hypothetical protein QAD02_008040 [Eretmocerus hayati]|uniref:Uncharacterized protein n=1 Tax=Eretmocerus hayati TaxID=131215 RepID=A0ACC2N6M9_9HYME|nr:hypothetical protein QAD02_008040 [Eretmocerus hayati]